MNCGNSHISNDTPKNDDPKCIPIFGIIFVKLWKLIFSQNFFIGY